MCGQADDPSQHDQPGNIVAGTGGAPGVLGTVAAEGPEAPDVSSSEHLSRTWRTYSGRIRTESIDLTASEIKYLLNLFETLDEIDRALAEGAVHYPVRRTQIRRKLSDAWTRAHKNANTGE